jgi:GTP-binding protein
VRDVVFAIGELVDQVVADAIDREGYVLHRPVMPNFTIGRAEDGTWVVEGVGAERAVRFSDLTNPLAVDLAAERLTRIGIDDALAAAGAVAGDTVAIGDIEFEYHESWEEEE